MKTIKKACRLVIALCLTIALVGCADASINVNVADDYSGNIQIVLGLDQQLLAVARSQGTDPMAEITADMDASWISAEKWIEGGMQWLQLEREFADIEELKQILGAMPVFREVSVEQDGREISFQGNLQPLNDEQPSVSDMESMGRAMGESMINFSLNVRLPGEVIETNGLFDRDKGAHSWQLNPYESTNVTFKTRVSFVDYIRNDLGLLFMVLASGALLVLLLIIMPLTYLGIRRRQKSTSYSDFDIS